MGSCRGDCDYNGDRCSKCDKYCCHYRDCDRGRPNINYSGYCIYCEPKLSNIEKIKKLLEENDVNYKDQLEIMKLIEEL